VTQREEPPPGYKTQSADTAYWAEKILFDHWRALEPWEKARKIDDLCRAAHRVTLVGLRQRHPGASETELELRAAALRLGNDLVLHWTGFDASR
jgi:hypothetical protein